MRIILFLFVEIKTSHLSNQLRNQNNDNQNSPQLKQHFGEVCQRYLKKDHILVLHMSWAA